jgi:hypothetical protein
LAFALSDPPATAEGLPRYPGPTVLITDALCYSAADIFAAGFQDNDLGRVLGTAEHTGAGGANVWTHEAAAPVAARPARRASGRRGLPRRAATRTGASVGVPLEESRRAGRPRAPPDPARHHEHNEDLLVAAVELLDADDSA